MILAGVFVLLGGALIALTASLAQHSLARAYSDTAPAAARLKQAIGEALRQSQPTPDARPGCGPGVSCPQSTSGAGGPKSAPSPTGTSTVISIPSKSPSEPLPSDLSSADAAAATAKIADAAAIRQKILAANNTYSAATEYNAVHDLIVESIAAAAVLIPAAVLLAWWLAGRSLRPVRRITDAARRASATQLSERLALDGPKDEITELGDTFDAMLDRLERAFDSQRRFIANASHELRTPLAVAGTAVDVVLAKPDRRPAQLEAMAHDVRGALRRAELLVDSLLALTRSQHLEHARDAVDLATITEDVLDEHRAAIAARCLTIDTTLADTPAVGDRVLLERLVTNLVDNAIRHNIDGGHLGLRTANIPGAVLLEITNTGPVIPPEQVPRLVEPFQRLAGRAHNAEAGLGLGLAIVAAVAEAHGATLSLAAVPGGGLTVEVRLPVAGGPALQP